MLQDWPTAMFFRVKVSYCLLTQTIALRLNHWTPHDTFPSIVRICSTIRFGRLWRVFGGGQVLTIPEPDPVPAFPTDLTAPTMNSLLAFDASAGAVIAAIQDGSTAPFDEAQFQTPGTARYAGFVAVPIQYQGFRDVAIGDTIISVRTNYQNGPIGAAQIDVIFGETPQVTGGADSFVVVSDAQTETLEGRFNPSDLTLDPAFDLLGVDGRLVISGSGISSSSQLIDGEIDPSTTKSVLSLQFDGTLILPAGVAQSDVEQDLVIDALVGTTFSGDSLRGFGHNRDPDRTSGFPSTSVVIVGQRE